MNDFTKEELINIKIMMLGYDHDDIELLNKIQSMIDNYKNNEMIINEPKNQLIECKCYKCGEILHIHPICNSESAWIKDCDLHRSEEKDE